MKREQALGPGTDALDSQDMLVLYLALNMLAKHTESELALASGAKRMAMTTMRQQIMSVRAKLVELERKPSELASARK